MAAKPGTDADGVSQESGHEPRNTRCRPTLYGWGYLQGMITTS